MSRTTIDGLKVRDSEPERRPVRTGRQSSHTIDMIRPATSGGQKPAVDHHRQKALNSIDTIRKKSSAASSFLDPVETFNFDNEPSSADEQFSVWVEADSSDLLNSSTSSQSSDT